MRTELSAQAVFTLLDQLTHWAEQQTLRAGAAGGSSSSAGNAQVGGSFQSGVSVALSEESKCELAHMWELLHSIPKPTLARAAFECQVRTCAQRDDGRCSCCNLVRRQKN